jgi:ubiquinone/menaquinone biosynthesis C-methylase UbiE
MKLKNIFTNLHKKTERNYIARMMNNKVHCMKVAKKYEKDYWDGNRKFGYGGYKYIPGRWTNVAKKIIRIYNLKSNSKILDIGCGKGFLLYEIKKILPKIEIHGFDISKHAIKNSKKEIKSYLFNSKVENKFKFKKNYFDLIICMGVLHNLTLIDISKTLREISRVSKQSFVMVESFRNDKELFNLQCWALTCQAFLKPNEWKWLFKINKYKGDFEFIYFE